MLSVKLLLAFRPFINILCASACLLLFCLFRLSFFASLQLFSSFHCQPDTPVSNLLLLGNVLVQQAVTQQFRHSYLRFPLYFPLQTSPPHTCFSICSVVSENGFCYTKGSKHLKRDRRTNDYSATNPAAKISQCY